MNTTLRLRTIGVLLPFAALAASAHAQSVHINVGSAVSTAVRQSQGWTVTTALGLTNSLGTATLTGIDANGKPQGINTWGSFSANYGYFGNYTCSFEIVFNPQSGNLGVKYDVWSVFSRTSGTFESIAWKATGLPGALAYMAKVNGTTPAGTVGSGGGVSGNGNLISNFTSSWTPIGSIYLSSGPTYTPVITYGPMRVMGIGE